MTYNNTGWSNHETWQAHSWLLNSKFAYDQLNEAIRNRITEDSTPTEIVTLFALFANTYLPDNAKKDIGDFLAVDWLEIGQHWIDELEL